MFLGSSRADLWKCETRNKSQHVLQYESRKYTFMLKYFTNGKSIRRLILHLLLSHHFIYKFSTFSWLKHFFFLFRLQHFTHRWCKLIFCSRSDYFLLSKWHASCAGASEKQARAVIYHNCITFSLVFGFHVDLHIFDTYLG